MPADPPNPIELRAERVAYAYPHAGREALRDVTVALRMGELVAVAGPNGSGKSTLLGVMLGFLRPARGTVQLRGIPMGQMPRMAVAREVCAIAQSEPALPGMTVRELVLLGRVPHAKGWVPVHSAHDANVAEEAMAAVGIDSLRERRVETLSGGERQLARIARAVAQQAPLMLLDEPTAALDLAHQQGIMRLLRSLCEKRGMGVLVVTHDLNLAAAWSDRIILLRDGAVAAEGPPSAILVEEKLRTVFGADLWTSTTPEGVPCLGLRR